MRNLEHLPDGDWIVQHYRGHAIRRDVYGGCMQVMRPDGTLLGHIPPSKSWAWGRAYVDQFLPSSHLWDATVYD